MGSQLTPRELHQANRAAWNEGAARYMEAIDEDIEFLRSGGTNFVEPEFDYLQRLNEWCGRAIHLQCAGGRDTLSLWNLGAAEVVGLDISDLMIECARRKSLALGAPATWYQCDVLDAPHELDGTADLVYTGRGALCWILDLPAWAHVAARLLKTGGRLYIFDSHPITWILDMNAAELSLDPEYGNYFDQEIHAGQGWPDQYIGQLAKKPEDQAKKYEHQWTLADVVNACVGAGLSVERLGEHPHQFWNAFPGIPNEVLARIPNTFSLLLRK